MFLIIVTGRIFIYVDVTCLSYNNKTHSKGVVLIKIVYFLKLKSYISPTACFNQPQLLLTVLLGSRVQHIDDQKNLP